MKGLRNFFFLAITSAVAVLAFFACINTQTVDAAKKYEYTSSQQVVQEYHTPQYALPSENESSNNKAQSAAASGTVLGAVKERFISPYNAGLSYNNVYVKNKTSFDINLKEELEQKLSFVIDKNNQPQVLIVHTHTTESYMNEDRDYYTDADYSRSTDEKQNMTAIGEIFAQQLNAAGIKTVHDKTVHDYPSYTGSYSRSADTIKAALTKYPSIKVVVDIHRDAIMANNADKTKPVVEIDGKKAAQVMLVMGSQDGNVTGFEGWRQNFRLAIRYHQIMEVMYPGLARPLVLAAKKYNEHLTTGSMLLEVGTDANSFEEACRSAEYAGKALAALLNTVR